MPDTTKINFYLQPIYNSKKHCFSDLEVLARFPMESGLETDVENSIAQAEQDGSIAGIDLAALKFACDKFPELKKYGIESIHVNLSPVTCAVPSLGRQIKQILDQTDTDPQNICIELTESNFSGNLAALLAVADMLIQFRFQLALDDVGKGESDFERIIHLPISHMKLDKSMAFHLDFNERIPRLISSLVQFTDASGMTITAEGVENAEVAEKLIALGCHYLQGYYFSKPLSYEQLLSWLSYHDLASPCFQH